MCPIAQLRKLIVYKYIVAKNLLESLSPFPNYFNPFADIPIRDRPKFKEGEDDN